MSALRASEVEHETVGEERMWRAVIAGAVQDWLSTSLRQQRDAEQYIFEDQKGFPMVCQLAGMDPQALREKLRRIQRQNALRTENRTELIAA